MFHQGHLNILRAARERCDRLVVGVTSDEALIRMKGRAPVIPLKERCDLVSSGAQLEAEMAEVGARVVYLPYTPSTSSTKLRRFIAPEDFSDEAPEQDAEKVEGEAQ